MVGTDSTIKVVVMKTISMIIFLFSQLAFGGGGDGTLPVIRSINIEFQAGQLQHQLNLPDCVNMKLAPSESKNKKYLKKKVDIKNASLVQTITLQKQSGVLGLKVDSKLRNNKLLDSQTKGLSESEFMNEVSMSNSTLIQSIQLNSSKSGCVNL